MTQVSYLFFNRLLGSTDEISVKLELRSCFGIWAFAFKIDVDLLICPQDEICVTKLLLIICEHYDCLCLEKNDGKLLINLHLENLHKGVFYWKCPINIYQELFSQNTKNRENFFSNHSSFCKSSISQKSLSGNTKEVSIIKHMKTNLQRTKYFVYFSKR